VIADAVPQRWPSHLARPALAAGAGACARVGLPRALFELRLDQLADVTSPDDRLAFLVGATIGADLPDWPPASHDERWAVVGAVPVADAWAALLEERGHRVVRIATDDAERAQRNGLRLLALRAGILT
jgi:2-keto-3-deoxy-galactonokinase